MGNRILAASSEVSCSRLKASRLFYERKNTGNVRSRVMGSRSLWCGVRDSKPTKQFECSLTLSPRNFQK